MAERTGNVFCVDIHSKLEVKPASMRKPEVEAFVARHNVHVESTNLRNLTRDEMKTAIDQFLQRNTKSASSRGTKLDLEPGVRTPVAMTSA